MYTVPTLIVLQKHEQQAGGQGGRDAPIQDWRHHSTPSADGPELRPDLHRHLLGMV